MNPVALYFASGESLYLGVLLLLVVIVVSPFLKKTWSARLRNVGAWIGLTMIVMACPPFPLGMYLTFVVVFLFWFIASNRTEATRTWMKVRHVSTGILVVLLLVLAVVEFSHRRMPLIVGEPSDHLVVIGDSISSGIDPHIPAWPVVLQQISGVSVTNLAKPGAQVSEALSMARQLTPDDHLVLIEIGGNDLLMGVSSEEFKQHLDALLSKVTAPERTVAMFELPLLPHKIAYGRIQRRLATKYRISLIPKRYLAGVISGANATSDGLHLSATGSRRMAALVAEVLSSVLKSAPDQRTNPL